MSSSFLDELNPNSVKIFEYPKDYYVLRLYFSNDSVKDILLKAFTIPVKNAHFIKSKITNQWDGLARIIKKVHDKEDKVWDTVIPKGLWFELYKVCKQNNIKAIFKDFAPTVKDLDLDKIKNYIDRSYNIQKHIKSDIRDFQYKCIFDLLKFKSILAEAVPASGKSLVMYILSRMMIDKKNQTLIIVPNIHLCDQMYKDFKNYGFSDIKEYVKILNGLVKDKSTNEKIIISTWQTIQNIENLDWVECLICDEGDLSKNKKSKYFNIIQRCKNKKYLLAMTGTVPSKKYSDYYDLVGNIGKHEIYTTEKMLEELNQITKVEIKVKILNYPLQDKREFYNNLYRDLEENDNIKLRDKNYFIAEKIDYSLFEKYIDKTCQITSIKNNKYQINNDAWVKKSWFIEDVGYLKELKLIAENKKRLKWLLSEIENQEGNVLMLFSKKSKEGYVLKEYFESNIYNNKKFIYIDGETKDKTDILETIRNTKTENIVLCAAIQVLGRGVTIKNLKFAYFITSMKSPEQVRQSIGRISRLCDNKDIAYFIDVVDNFTLRENEKLFTNNSTDSFLQREAEYIKRGYSVIKEKINLE
jgi:superfamily II DNA or RNA helicase